MDIGDSGFIIRTISNWAKDGALGTPVHICCVECFNTSRIYTKDVRLVR